MAISDKTKALFDTKALGMLGIVSEDGTAQVTPVWIMLDGDTPVFNTVIGSPKERNMRRDPRVTLTIVDPDDIYSYVELRGRVEFEEGQAAVRHDRRTGEEVHRAGHVPLEPAGRTCASTAVWSSSESSGRDERPAHPHRCARRPAALHLPADARHLAARRGRGRRHALHLGSLLPALRRARRRALRVLEPARRDGGGHGAHPFRRARQLQLVPQPEPAGRHGAHGRPHLAAAG